MIKRLNDSYVKTFKQILTVGDQVKAKRGRKCEEKGNDSDTRLPVVLHGDLLGA